MRRDGVAAGAGAAWGGQPMNEPGQVVRLVPGASPGQQEIVCIVKKKYNKNKIAEAE